MRKRWLFTWFVFVLGCGEVLELQPDASTPPPPDADPCTGVCECRVDSDCAAANTGCNDQVTSRTCDCVAGYAKNLAGTCEFSGVVADPGFQSTATWTANAATIDVNLNEAGMVEPGAVRYTGKGMCDLARISQTITMPKLSRAEPLVAQITYRLRDPDFFGAHTPAFGIGPTWQDALPRHLNTFQTTRICLGAGQYAPESTPGLGADVELAMMPAQLPLFVACDDPNVTLDVDRFDIVVANPDECPAPGTAINGDAEEGMTGWTLTGSSANGNPFSTTIEPNIGETNSRAVRLFARNRCSNLSATNTLSVPSAEDVPSPAISFFNKTTATQAANQPPVDTDSTLAQVRLPAISATGTAITQRVCVPAFMRGGVYAFAARLDLSGTCADLVNAESIIDSLKVIDDPSCGTNTSITDPGFESQLALIGATSTPGKSLARTLNDPQSAHSGNGVLQLSVMQLCSGASWQANVVVPPASGDQGPALRFFYKATPAANYSFRVSTPGASFTPTLDNQYNQGTICLDPKLVGRNQVVNFAMSGGGGTCANTHPPETAFVDDLEVITDPSCPTM